MIIQNCNPLLVILSKIESIMADHKSQHPHLNDDEIIEIIKIKFSIENNS